MYEIEFEKDVLIFLKKLKSKNILKGILKKIESLKENPFPKNKKKIQNTKEKVFRIRVSNYRILYRLKKNKIIIIFLIGKRNNVYKKLEK